MGEKELLTNIILMDANSEVIEIHHVFSEEVTFKLQKALLEPKLDSSDFNAVIKELVEFVE